MIFKKLTNVKFHQISYETEDKSEPYIIHIRNGVGRGYENKEIYQDSRYIKAFMHSLRRYGFYPVVVIEKKIDNLAIIPIGLVASSISFSATVMFVNGTCVKNRFGAAHEAIFPDLSEKVFRKQARKLHWRKFVRKHHDVISRLLKLEDFSDTFPY